MNQAKDTRIDEDVIQAVDSDIHNFVSTSLLMFERHAITPNALIMLVAYTAMQLHAGVYSAAPDQENREATLELGRQLAPMLLKVFTSDQPDLAWRRVADTDTPVAFADPVAH